MTDMYMVGKRYRWWRERGPTAYLNGTECTVIGPPKLMMHPAGFPIVAQETDSYCPIRRSSACAFRGDLLPIQDDDTLMNKDEEICGETVLQ